MFMNPILIKVDRSETPSKQLCSGSTVSKSGNQQKCWNSILENRMETRENLAVPFPKPMGKLWET